MGRRLAIEQPGRGRPVVPVPDSGVAAAIGYANESGINYRQAIIRNHYVGRTFIEPSQSIRSFGVRLKLNPIRDLIAGRRIVLIDDSIVRGTTSKKIVQMVREAGAAEVHMRISCPPTISPCYYGVDTPRKEDLIAAKCRSKRFASILVPTASAISRMRECLKRSASTPTQPAPPAGPAPIRPLSLILKPRRTLFRCPELVRRGVRSVLWACPQGVRKGVRSGKSLRKVGLVELSGFYWKKRSTGVPGCVPSGGPWGVPMGANVRKPLNICGLGVGGLLFLPETEKYCFQRPIAPCAGGDCGISGAGKGMGVCMGYMGLDDK
jgi:hypothetical protein